MTGPEALSLTGDVQQRRRLHPLSPLLNSAKILAALTAVISIQGFAQLGWRGGVGILLVVAVGAMGISAISWLVTGYHLVGRELRIHDGVLVRRTRAIPLERLQSVEVVRPLLARATGLAELRLEVVGRGKTEAPLAFLTAAEAAALREHLLSLAARAGAATTEPSADQTPTPTLAAATTEPSADQTPAPAAPAAPAALEAPAPETPAPETPAPETPAAASPTPGSAEQPLHQVVNREVVISQLLTPQMLFLPFGIVLVATQYLFRTALTLVVMLSMVVAVIGVVQQPVRRILSDWDFRVALQAPPAGQRYPGLRLRHGLTETRSQTVPLNRVQAIGVTWPLLWRRRRWLRCRLDVAGFSSAEQGTVAASDQLLPVGDLATAHRLSAVVLPGLDLTALRLSTPPARARWVAPIRRPVLGVTLTDRVLATRDGRVTRRLVVVPYARIQSVRVVQGPLQRRLRLATVYVDTAGSLTAAAHHRDLAEARQLAGELTERARAARAAASTTS